MFFLGTVCSLGSSTPFSGGLDSLCPSDGLTSLVFLSLFPVVWPLGVFPTFLGWFIRLRRRPRALPVDECVRGVGANPEPRYHCFGGFRHWRITLRSLVACIPKRFGTHGRRRVFLWRYHGLSPWGSYSLGFSTAFFGLTRLLLLSRLLPEPRALVVQQAAQAEQVVKDSLALLLRVGWVSPSDPALPAPRAQVSRPYRVDRVVPVPRAEAQRLDREVPSDPV